MLFLAVPQPAATHEQPWFTPQLAVSCAGLIVSVLALSATLVFFRRLNTRRGSLSSVRPHSFGYEGVDTGATIVIPLVIYNDGAVPIVVQDVRLRLDKTNALFVQDRRADEAYIKSRADDYGPGARLEDQARPEELVLGWRSERDSVWLHSSDGDRPAVFPVPGRNTVTKIFEFEGYRSGNRRHQGQVIAKVQVLVAHKKGWKDLCTFDLHPPKLQSAQFDVYPNEPQGFYRTQASGG